MRETQSKKWDIITIMVTIPKTKNKQSEGG